MSKQYYLATSETGKANNFIQFRDNIGPYVATLELAAADITQQAADAAYFQALLPLCGTMTDASRQWTKWKSITLAGDLGDEPVLPAKPTGFPPSVPPGIVTRFTTLVRTIKNHKNYTPPIGQILGIEGEESSGPDLDVVHPALTLALSGGSVRVGWGWEGYSNYLDLCEIQVDRGDGRGFQLLTYDTTPSYEDTAPHPAAPAKWTYRAIYRIGDHQVGQWSPDVSISVG